MVVKKAKVGLIRVLTTNDQDLLELHGKKVMEWFSDPR